MQESEILIRVEFCEDPYVGRLLVWVQHPLALWNKGGKSECEYHIVNGQRARQICYFNAAQIAASFDLATIVQ